MIPDQALRSPVAVAFDKAAVGGELTERDEAMLRDLESATPEEIREALDATGGKRHPALMVKMRLGPPGEE